MFRATEVQSVKQNQLSVINLLRVPKSAPTQNLVSSSHMLMLDFSSQDGSKKMAGRGVVGQSGTDLGCGKNPLQLLVGPQCPSVRVMPY